MPILYINTGTNSNSGNGDSIRTAFTKVNQNFTSLQNTIDNSPAFNLDPVFDSITVINTSTLLGDVYLNTSSARLSYDPVTNGIALNFFPILGSYKFVFNNLITPKNALIGSTSTFIYSPKIFLEEVSSTSSSITTGSARVVAGRSQMLLNTDALPGNNRGAVASIGTVDIINSATYLAGVGAVSTNGYMPSVGVYSASTGTPFTITTTSGRSQDYAIGLVSLRGPELTGVLANSRGVWINGGPDGVNIANTSHSWQFNANGGIVFPDGTIQGSAAGLITGLSDRLTSGTSALVLTGQGVLTLDQQGAYNGEEVPGTLFRIDTDQPNYTQVTVQNINTGTTATSDIIFIRNNGSVESATGLLDIGINSSNYVEEENFGVHTPGSAYIFTNDADLIIGTQNPGKRLIFHAGGSTTLDSAGYLDDSAWVFNRAVQTIIGTPGPLNFTVRNTLNNSAAQAIYQAMNNIGDYVQLGINSTNSGTSYGAIGPRDAFVHIDGSTATLHIGSSGNLVFWSEESTGGYNNGTTATLVMSKLDRSSTFGGHLLPAENLSYDLGSSSTQWRSLWVGTSTIYIGKVPLTIDTATNKLIVGSTNLSTSTNLATESYVIDYVATHGGSGGGGLSISDFGLGFVNNLDNGKITTSKLYNKNPNPGLNNQYTLEVTDGGVVALPDGSIINGATLKTVAGNYAGITAGPQGADEDSWMWVDNDGATISTKYSTDQFTWKFTNSGTFTLPYGQSIGSGTLDGIKLTTDRGTVLFGNTPECVPTLASHFHIMRDDPTTVDLFFGDDYNYVKLPYYSTLTNVGVEINADGYSWQFDKSGVLTVPSGMTIGDEGGGQGIYGSDNASIGVGAQGSGGSVSLVWVDNRSTIGSTSTQTQVAGVILNSPLASSSGTVQIATGLATGLTVQNVWEFGANGNLTVPDDIQDVNGSVIRVATTSTAPTRVNGQLWFNSEEGRTYIKYNGQWIDASPTIVPRPETYLGNITIDDDILNINGSTLTISNTGTLLVNGAEVTGSGSSVSFEYSTVQEGLSGGDGVTSITGDHAYDTGVGLTSEKWAQLMWVPDTSVVTVDDIDDGPAVYNWAYVDDSGFIVETDDGTDEYRWKFNKDGVLMLPNAGDIQRNGISVLGGGSASTNSINSGSYSVSIVDSGVVTMATSRGNIEFGALPEPGGPSHFHIMKASSSTDVDLYFGDDYNYVLQRGNSMSELAGHTNDYGVEIGTRDLSTGTSQQYVWRFGTDGSLTLPDGGPILFGGNNCQIQALQGFTISSDGGIVVEVIDKQWLFGPDGELTLPDNAPVIRGGGTGTDVTVIASDGTNTSTWVFGANGTLTLPTFAGSPSIVTIESFSNVSLGSNLYYWNFGTDGNLTFPNNSKFDGQTLTDHSSSTNYTLKIANGGGAGSVFGIGTGDATYGIANDALNHALNGYVPYTVTAQRIDLTVPGGGTWTLDSDGTTAFPDNTLQSPPGEYLIIQSDTSVALQWATTGTIALHPTQSSFEVGAFGAVITATTGTDVGSQVGSAWTFLPNGNMRFPDSTVQTTAYTGTVAYSNITGAPTPTYTSTYTGWFKAAGTVVQLDTLLARINSTGTMQISSTIVETIGQGSAFAWNGVRNKGATMSSFGQGGTNWVMPGDWLDISATPLDNEFEVATVSVFKLGGTGSLYRITYVGATNNKWSVNIERVAQG